MLANPQIAPPTRLACCVVSLLAKTTGESRRPYGELALSLLMTRITADHVHSPLATHDLAVLADPLDTGTYFHDDILLRITNAVDTKPRSIENCAGSWKA